MEYQSRITDEQLVKLYELGDNDAFDQLLARHQNKIYTYINYMVHDENLANDIFQEVFIKVIKNIKDGKYVESGKFSAWISRIAHNIVIDSFRQKKNERWLTDEETGGKLFNNSEIEESYAERDLINQQTLDDVKSLMECLPESQRKVLYMRYYQDLSFKEIAENTGVSINTALGRMRYALMNMRKIAQTKNISLAMS